MTDISKAPEGKIVGGHMLARALKAKGSTGSKHAQS